LLWFCSTAVSDWLKLLVTFSKPIRFKTETDQAPVVQKMTSAIHQINLYPVDNGIGFPNTYPLVSDLSGG